MCQYDEDDELWSAEGQREADQKLAAVYKKMGREDIRGGFCGPHKFDLETQKDAFDWFDGWLQPPSRV